MPACLLDRSVIAVRGEEARVFLQGLVTCDMNKVAPGKPAFGALLSPQGKILFDFIVVENDGGFLLDAPRALAADLLKRLTFYKLRAKVTLADLSSGEDRLVVVALIGGEKAPANAIVHADPRAVALGERAILPEREAGFARDDIAVYERARIAAGAPRGGADFPYGDVFPHDVNMDLLNGVDFAKGCYVGQEVVSRMHHRGLIRRRVTPVAVEGAAAPMTPISAGAASVGALGATVDGAGLALVRLDRLQDALDDGATLKAGEAVVRARPFDHLKAG